VLVYSDQIYSYELASLAQFGSELHRRTAFFSGVWQHCRLLPTGDITLITGILLAFAALSAAETRATQEVICAETAFSRAAEYRDKALFLSFVDPDARFVSGQVARGRAEVGETWAIFFETDGPQIRWRPRVVAVSSDGRLALSRGPYRTVSTDVNGERIESWGTFISTWRLGADGKWKVLFDTGANVGMTPGDDDRSVLDGEPECP
jgi:ketosteroid isomerase-like protein